MKYEKKQGALEQKIIKQYEDLEALYGELLKIADKIQIANDESDRTTDEFDKKYGEDNGYDLQTKYGGAKKMKNAHEAYRRGFT